MNNRNTYNITCPSCRHQQDVNLVQMLNATQQPELRQALMENQLNRINCDQCKMSLRIDTPLLYSDPQQNIMIHWVPLNKSLTREMVQEDFENSLEELRNITPSTESTPTVWMVFTRVELVELIYLLEAKMNVRVVEYIKYTIYTRNTEKLPSNKYRLLLNVQDSTDEELCFVVQDIEEQKLGTLLRYGRAAYDSMCELYKECADDFYDMFPGPYISARSVLMEEQEE